MSHILPEANLEYLIEGPFKRLLLIVNKSNVCQEVVEEGAGALFLLPEEVGVGHLGEVLGVGEVRGKDLMVQEDCRSRHS
jgi:hypothetical protein